ncbi:MAG: hypothetical protein Q8P39_02315 [Candidatus Yanofskybacteria bacterium]|nr:hypothetical protein [Candidatus Yanofskybacteria bacterium]
MSYCSQKQEKSVFLWRKKAVFAFLVGTVLCVSLLFPAPFPIALSAEDVPAEDVPAEDVPAEDIPMEDIPLGSFPSSDVPLDSNPVGDTPSENSPLAEDSFSDSAPAESNPPEDLAAEDVPEEDVSLEELPAEDIPVENTPSDEALPEDNPADDTPVEDVLTEDVLAEDTSLEDIPAEDSSSEDISAVDTPTEEDIPAEDVSVEGTLAEDIPTENAPAEDVPVEDVPAEDVPFEGILAEDVPSDEAPAEDVPVEDIPAEDVPVEDVPAEDVPFEDNSTDPGQDPGPGSDSSPTPGSDPDPDPAASSHSLSVALSANPSSGTAPFTSTLQATVSSTVSEAILYRLFCDASQSAPNEAGATAASSEIQFDCVYENAGTFTAKVEVEWSTLSASDTADIIVTDAGTETDTGDSPGSPSVSSGSSGSGGGFSSGFSSTPVVPENFDLSVRVRNITADHAEFQREVSAEAGDVLEFHVTVLSTDERPISNLVVQNIPGNLEYLHASDTTLLEVLPARESAVLTFYARVPAQEHLSIGQNTFLYLVSASTPNTVLVDFSTIDAYRAPAPLPVLPEAPSAPLLPEQVGQPTTESSGLHAIVLPPLAEDREVLGLRQVVAAAVHALATMFEDTRYAMVFLLPIPLTILILLVSIWGGSFLRQMRVPRGKQTELSAHTQENPPIFLGPGSFS